MVTYENVFVFLIGKKLICMVQPSFIDSFNAFTVHKWIDICEMLAEKTKLFLLAAYLTQRDLFIWKHLLRFWTLFLNTSCITSYLPVQHLLGQLTRTTESVRWPCCKKTLLTFYNIFLLKSARAVKDWWVVQGVHHLSPLTDGWIEISKGYLQLKLLGKHLLPAESFWPSLISLKN